MPSALSIVVVVVVYSIVCLQLCLREFDNNPEVVINRVLENNLPPHIQSVDFSLSSAPPPAPPPSDGQGAQGKLETRESVYDNDEFDVFRRPGAVDLSRVHIGKK